MSGAPIVMVIFVFRTSKYVSIHDFNKIGGVRVRTLIQIVELSLTGMHRTGYRGGRRLSRSKERTFQRSTRANARNADLRSTAGRSRRRAILVISI